MKKTIGLTTVLVAIFALFLVNFDLASAQSDPSSVSGAVRLEGSKIFGDPTNGGFSSLNSGAGFNILPSGECKQTAAEGIAAAKGALGAGGKVNDNSLSLNSLAHTTTDAKGSGNGAVNTDGLVQRANWGTLANGPSSISGWDASQGQYSGVASGPSPSILGKGVTDGTMDLSITPNSTTGKLTDNSLASVKGTPGTADPSIQGGAGLASGTRVNGPDFIAAATTDARAAYSATDPKKVSGGLEINSNTAVTQSPNGSVSLKAVTDAKSFTKTGPTCGGCR